jgi:acyl-CoA thioesterase II
MRFAELMALEPAGEDAFLGRSADYPWGGVYGGQLAAQALRAAAETVPAEQRPSSLHASYIRRARACEPIVFEVERTRDGRRSASRTVRARQSAGTILTLLASFHDGDDAGGGAQPAVAPAVPTPDACLPGGWSTMFECRYAPANGKVAVWLRMNDAAGIDEALAPYALAFMADDIPGDAALALARRDGHAAMSLDHSVWFHRAPPAGGWQLQVFACQSIAGGRGMVVGQAFDMDGTHIATVTQEVLLRERERM